MFEIWEGEADGRGTENVDVCANGEAEKARKHREKTPSLNHFIHLQQQGAELLKPRSNISVFFLKFTCDRSYRHLQLPTVTPPSSHLIPVS